MGLEINFGNTVPCTQQEKEPKKSQASLYGTFIGGAIGSFNGVYQKFEIPSDTAVIINSKTNNYPGFINKIGQKVSDTTKAAKQTINKTDFAKRIKSKFQGNKDKVLFRLAVGEKGENGYSPIGFYAVKESSKKLPSNISAIRKIEVPPNSIVVLPGKKNIAFKTNVDTKAAFRKVLDPLDEKIFSAVENLPLGERFTKGLRRSNTPIKSFKSDLLKSFGYNKKLILKGLLFGSSLGFWLGAAIEIVKNIKNKNKEN